MQNWKIGDKFYRIDVDKRFLDEQVTILNGKRYVNSIITGEIQIFTVEKISSDNRLCSMGCGFHPDICEKIDTN